MAKNCMQSYHLCKNGVLEIDEREGGSKGARERGRKGRKERRREGRK